MIINELIDYLPLFQSLFCITLIVCAILLTRLKYREFEFKRFNKVKPTLFEKIKKSIFSED